MSAAISLVSRAAAFAAARHTGQMNKAGQAPYVNHLAEVACLLAEGPAGDDPDLIAAAWLHDIVEDSRASSEEIGERFGVGIRNLVDELTDDMSLPGDERKRRQVAEIAARSRRARLLKLADKTSNVRDVIDCPPGDWSEARIRAYVEWGQAVVDAGCRGLDPRLEAEFDRQAARALGPR